MANPMKFAALIFTLLGAIAPAAQSAIYYVATTGSDTIAGAGTEALPFRTIQKCGSVMNPGDTCRIRAGTYRESVTPARSGSSGLPITFEAYPGESAIGQRIIVPMSGRVVPASAWSTPPEPRYRRVPGGGSAANRHRVRAGETPSAIARRYRVGLTALLNANGMTMGSVIRPGDWLRIPK